MEKSRHSLILFVAFLFSLSWAIGAELFLQFFLPHFDSFGRAPPAWILWSFRTLHLHWFHTGLFLVILIVFYKRNPFPQDRFARTVLIASVAATLPLTFLAMVPLFYRTAPAGMMEKLQLD